MLYSNTILISKFLYYIPIKYSYPFMNTTFFYILNNNLIIHIIRKLRFIHKLFHLFVFNIDPTN